MEKLSITLSEERMPNPILESTRFVVDHAKHVKINKNMLIEFCRHFDHTNDENIRHWLDDAPFDITKLNPDERLNFLLVFNSISFCYWGEPKWTIEYHGKFFDGAWGMIAALKKGIEEGKLYLKADFLANISKDQLKYILRGNVEIPLLEERWKILKEIGIILKKKYDGELGQLIKEGEKDAVKLLNLIIDTFPSFKDISFYKGKEIMFYKRAQLLVADIYQAFKQNGYGYLKNTSQLTACADYKLPKILRKNEILVYSKELSNKIDHKIPIMKGSQEEVEIRACTIWAVKYLERLLEPKILYIDSIHVNDHLWLLSQNKFPDDKPYHRTKTTSY